MPTVALQGGLGNQLFQYAVGRALARRTGSALKLETSTLIPSTNADTPQRPLHLSRFSIQGQIVHNSVRKNPLLAAQMRLFNVTRKISDGLAVFLCRVYKEKSPQRFDPHVLALPKDTYLVGYFHSEKYFFDIRSTLLEELSLQTAATGMNREWRNAIESVNSVGIHVRRGDYVERGWTLPSQYYQRAIQVIQAMERNVEWFFFSDDIDWVKKHTRRLLPDGISVRTVHHVECNGSHDAPEELRLMKRCRHNIIANSTFSWWAAWLNQNENKVVVAPAHWIRERTENLDIIPSRWRIVDW